jgi:hypothetical protein
MAGQGRHSEYTPEIGDRICDLVSTDTSCLDEICAKYPDLPCADTVYTWRHRHSDFAEKYLRAMHSRGNLYAEETIKIAREKPTYFDAEGNERVDAGGVAWLKLNVNLRQWHASKLAPKTFGDKQQVEQVTTENEQLKAELAELRAKLAEKAKSEY